MGLDIYFHKTAHTEWERYQKDLAAYENLPEDGKSMDNHPDNNFHPEDIGYFRKVNFLMEFFHYEGNCEYKEIGRDELERRFSGSRGFSGVLGRQRRRMSTPRRTRGGVPKSCPRRAVSSSGVRSTTLGTSTM